MSGIIGHTTYAILAAKAAQRYRLPVASVLTRHFASYLAGSYLGCDVQTLPEAICLDSGQEVGYGTAPLEKSPITGGPVRPWKLAFGNARYTPYDVHRMFYGRAHLVFGWGPEERNLAVDYERLPDYLAAVAGDAMTLFGPGHRPLAYVLGWVTHLVGDCLIKSVQPGVTLHLLDGKYTQRNRPIQDLVTFHEIGRKELGLNWPALLSDLADTPVEPIQLHYMRVARAQGRLALEFPHDWATEHESLLKEVLAENRRYQRVRNNRLLQKLALEPVAGGWQCHADLRRQSGGLSYPEMVKESQRADFRHALWQIAEAVVDLFVQMIQKQPLLADIPVDSGPDWEKITQKWCTR